MELIKGRLENWSIVFWGSETYDAPETRDYRVNGIIYGSLYFRDGESITTSPIVKFENETELKEVKVYTASGSIYILGEVNPDYEKCFPNAKKRLFGEVKPC